MAYLWTITIGFILCLAILFGGFFYVLKSVLNTQDAKKIDSPPEMKK